MSIRENSPFQTSKRPANEASTPIGPMIHVRKIMMQFALRVHEVRSSHCRPTDHPRRNLAPFAGLALGLEKAKEASTTRQFPDFATNQLPNDFDHNTTRFAAIQHCQRMHDHGGGAGSQQILPANCRSGARPAKNWTHRRPHKLRRHSIRANLIMSGRYRIICQQVL
jgi:hypothetical protein